jgi:diguanylate cyclase (GGDEF)-like protein/PAS domain S-box-containing protein
MGLLQSREGLAPLDDATWRARHRVMGWVLVLQAAVVLAWADVVFGFAHALVELSPLVVLGAATAVRSAGRTTRSCAMALALFTESAIFVHLSGGMVELHFHFFVMLCLLAQYEQAAPFALGVGYVVLQHGLMGRLMPHEVYGDSAEALHPWTWAAIHGGYVLAISAVLVAGWRVNGRLRTSDRAERARAERYLAVAGVMLVALDRDGRIRVANRETCELLGRDETDLLGRDWFSVALRSRVQAKSRASFDRLLAGDRAVRVTHEEILIGADGSQRLIEWRTVLQADGDRVLGTLSSGTDITDRRRAEREIARDQRDLRCLRDLARAVASEDDARDTVVSGILDLAGAQLAALVEPDDKRSSLAVTATTFAPIAGQIFKLGAEASGVGVAFLSAEAFFVADTNGHPAVSRRMVELTQTCSVLYQPVIVEGATAGVLVLGWSQPVAELTPRAADLAALAADNAALAIGRLTAMHSLERLALTDPLTGVANRRSLDRELPVAIAEAARTRAPLALAMLDLNGFKALNDRVGHEAGDRVLKECAAAWQGELRAADTLLRLGGDEFAVLLPGCDLEVAERVAGRLRAALRHEAGCGVGVAIWDGTEDAASVMRRADRALYLDKPRTTTAGIEGEAA